MREQRSTDRSMYQRLRVCALELSSLIREISHGASRHDPHETRISRANRNVSGRVGFGRVGSTVFKSRGSGQVGPRDFQNLAGQVGSGQDMSKLSRVGSVQATRPHPTQPVRFDLTRESPDILLLQSVICAILFFVLTKQNRVQIRSNRY